MKITVVALLLHCICMMAFASENFTNTADSKPAAAKPTTIEGGNGVTLPPPPPTEVKPVTETIHGTTITDPYRWLEDAQSPATRAWIAAQMKYTEDYLAQVKIRPEIVKRLTELMRVETYSIPIEAERTLLLHQAPGGREPGVRSTCVRDCTVPTSGWWMPPSSAPTRTHTSALPMFRKTALCCCTGVREGGADEESVHILDVNYWQRSCRRAAARPLPGHQSHARQEGHLLLEV